MGDALQREQLSIDGRVVLSYLSIPGTPPLADVAEAIGPVREAASTVINELPGWRIASTDKQLADELVRTGCRLVRHSHLFTMDVRESSNASLEAEHRLTDKFKSLTFSPAEHADRGALVEVSLAAYPVGHPDAETQDRAIVGADIDALLTGAEVGSLIPHASEVAVSTAQSNPVVVGLVILNEMPGVAPTGGPWVSEVCRSPESRYSGLGSFLLVRAIRHLRERGQQTLSLVVTEGNPARATYERLGFEVVSTSWKLQVPGVTESSLPTS